MKIGYNEATALGCSTLENDLRLCEECGFDFIEIRMDMLRDYLLRKPLDELKRFFASSRLRPHAMNAFYLYPQFLSENDDPVRRQALLDEILLGFTVAREIGSHNAIVVAPLQRDPKGGPYVGGWDETFRECVRILRRLSTLGDFYGVNICFELVGFNRSSVRSVGEADAIVREVNRPNVGFVLDSYNIHLNGGINDFSVMKQVDPGRIFAAHINNADPVPEAEMGQDKRRFPDQGVVDVDNFLRALKECGYEGMVSVETFRPEYWQRDPEWVIREAYRTTRAVMERNGVFA